MSVSWTRSAPLLAPWRESLLTRLFHSFAIIALFALIPGVLAAVNEAEPAILIVNLVAYALLIPAYLLRRTRYVASVTILVFSQLAVGGIIVFTVGVESAAILWILAPLIIANLLLGRRATGAVFAVGVALMGAISILLHLDRLPWTVPLTVWYSIVGSFFTVAALIIYSSRFLIDHLTRGLASEQTLNNELNHRVKNNLQLMGSLILLHRGHVRTDEARKTLEHLSTRLAAMSRTFQLLDRRDGTLRVPLSELLLALIGDGETHGATAGQPVFEWIDGPEYLAIEDAIPIAMIVSELLHAAQEEQPDGISLSVAEPEAREANNRAVEIRVAIATSHSLPQPLLSDALSADIVAALSEQIPATMTESHSPELTLVQVRFPWTVSSPSAAP